MTKVTGFSRPTSSVAIFSFSSSPVLLSVTKVTGFSNSRPTSSVAIFSFSSSLLLSATSLVTGFSRPTSSVAIF